MGRVDNRWDSSPKFLWPPPQTHGFLPQTPDDTHRAGPYGNSKDHMGRTLCQPCLPQLPQPGHFLEGTALPTVCKAGSILAGLHHQLWGPMCPQESWCPCGHQPSGFSESLLHWPEPGGHGHEKDSRQSCTGHYSPLTLSHPHTDLMKVGIIMPIFSKREMDIPEMQVVCPASFSCHGKAWCIPACLTPCLAHPGAYPQTPPGDFSPN